MRREEEGTDVDGGFLDDLDIASLQNLERRRLSWSHRFVCDVASLLVIPLVVKSEGEEGVTDFDGGLLDDLDVNFPLPNIDVDIFRISGEDFSGLNLLFRIDTGGVDLFRIFSVLNLLFRITDSCVMW